MRLRRFLVIWLLTMSGWAQSLPLTPLPGSPAPVLTQIVKVRFVTTAGNLLLEVYPQAAPNASQRFLELVRKGFYDFTPVSRVVPEFVCQFGINWRAPFVDYQNNNFKDDPSYFQLAPGTLAFAKSGPDSNSTQVFINYGDNSRLIEQGFTAFGKVVEGLDVAEKFAQVGDPGGGLEQDQLWTRGDAYLKKLTRQPSYILFAEVL